MAKKVNNGNSYRPNMWGMIRDIAIASINKGQFPFAIIGAVLIILILKLTPEDSSKILNGVLNNFLNYYKLGWFLTGFTLFGWYFGSKRQRKIFTSEINRIAEEKKQLQQALSNKKLTSSNNK